MLELCHLERLLFNSRVQHTGISKQMVEGIHAMAVTQWLCQNIEEVEVPLEFSLLAGGHSNLTYRAVDAAGRVLVLRRPPLGHVLESAHDMGREHKIIAALAGSNVPVAPALGLCTDISVNDVPFCLMEFVDGTVLGDAGAADALRWPTAPASGAT
jgi:aminoglycoside phosphotransferase (APT) family kinase protein